MKGESMHRKARISANPLFFLFLFLAMAVAPLYTQVLDRPVAIVRLNETVSIGQRQLRQDVDLIQRQAGRDLTSSERAELLEERINGVLLTQAAQEANVRVNDEEIEQAIAAQRQSLGQPVNDSQFRQLVEEQMGLTWDAFVEEVRNRLIQEKFVIERMQGRGQEVSEPTDEDIRFVYETNAQEFFNPLMIRFEHLFFDVREKSDAEVSELRQKATTMARQLSRGTTEYAALMRSSLDDVSYSGGDFGYLINGDQQAMQRLGRSFVEAVFRLEDGEISGLLESNVGFHIVRVTDRRAPRLPGLNDPVMPGEGITVRQQVRAFLQNQQQQEIFEDTVSTVVRELREKAEITRYPERLNW
jgi:peptidyl-prolyl cis-trans isomerase SurA